MTGRIKDRLTKIGIKLPPAAKPVANYLPFIISDNLIFISGQVPIIDGKPQFLGQLGENITIEEGYQAARLCGINIIAQTNAACEGNLDRVKRVTKLGGFVNSSNDFMDQPKVINGASDLMVEVFGHDIGQHARFAVSAPALPLGVSVEIDAIIEFR
tara:strand:- start:536 stop:1006 length:471 start_codon:yes stop_codon:yes gene_type:complete